jgi:hypothetical protein
MDFINKCVFKELKTVLTKIYCKNKSNNHNKEIKERKWRYIKYTLRKEIHNVP